MNEDFFYLLNIWSHWVEFSARCHLSETPGGGCTLPTQQQPPFVSPNGKVKGPAKGRTDFGRGEPGAEFLMPGRFFSKVTKKGSPKRPLIFLKKNVFPKMTIILVGFFFWINNNLKGTFFLWPLEGPSVCLMFERITKSSKTNQPVWMWKEIP